MALLWFDGFDSYNSTQDFVIARGGNPAGCSISQNQGRFGKNAIYGVSNNSRISFGSDVTELWTGRAVKITARWDETVLIGFYSSLGIECYLSATVLGTIAAYRTGAVKLGETANVFRPSSYQWLEVRCKLGESQTGEIEVWLNDIRVLNLTGITTKYNSAATGINAISLGSLSGWSNTPSSYVDDVYVLDTTGVAPWNTRLGDICIESLLPSSDSAPNNGVPLTGLLHYEMVNETPGFNTTDYITLQNQANQAEVFGHSQLNNNVTSVLGMNIMSTSKKSDAGTAIYKNIIVNNSTIVGGNSNYLSTNYRTNVDIWEKNPLTLQQWTKLEINSTTFGVMVE